MTESVRQVHVTREHALYKVNRVLRDPNIDVQRILPRTRSINVRLPIKSNFVEVLTLPLLPLQDMAVRNTLGPWGCRFRPLNNFSRFPGPSRCVANGNEVARIRLDGLFVYRPDWFRHVNVKRVSITLRLGRRLPRCHMRLPSCFPVFSIVKEQFFPLVDISQSNILQDDCARVGADFPKVIQRQVQPRIMRWRPFDQRRSTFGFRLL